jgi:hypothetical protein
LEKSGVSSIGDFWLWMEHLRTIGEILWYNDYGRGKIVVLKVFDSPIWSTSPIYLFIYLTILNGITTTTRGSL